MVRCVIPSIERKILDEICESTWNPACGYVMRLECHADWSLNSTESPCDTDRLGSFLADALVCCEKGGMLGKSDGICFDE
jgi:hypothetical protein